MAGVESVVGAYPYHFVHIEIVALGPIYAGLSYNEFIEIDPEAIDRETTIHELTHSTLYGIFPLWFEEGMAHFVQHYLTGSLEEGTRLYSGHLRQLARDQRLDLRYRTSYTFADEIAERAQGFLFISAFHDAQGIDGVVETLKPLRKQTFNGNGQDLIAEMARLGSAETQAKTAKVICEHTIGARRDYCVPLP
jgi:hypothetical protein